MGVVLYIMLSGKVPFPGRSEPEIITNVMKGDYHFNHPAFANVSEECKDLIRLCLIKDYKKRITAQEGLEHPWFSKYADIDALNSGTIGEKQDSEVIEGISEVVNESRNPKQTVFNYLARAVNENNFEGLTHDLNELDDGSGVMDSEMFVRCLSKNHMKIGPAQLETLLKTLQEEKTGSVNYKDFLKFSYLTHLFRNHCMLEHAMRDADSS